MFCQKTDVVYCHRNLNPLDIFNHYLHKHYLAEVAETFAMENIHHWIRHWLVYHTMWTVRTLQKPVRHREVKTNILAELQWSHTSVGSSVQHPPNESSYLSIRLSVSMSLIKKMPVCGDRCIWKREKRWRFYWWGECCIRTVNSSHESA